MTGEQIVRPRPNPVIWAFTATVALFAAAVQWFVVPHSAGAAEQWPWVWPVLVTAGFVGAELVVVHLRLGREAYTFSLMEIPLVLGLFFVQPDLLIWCRLTGAVLAFVWQRKALEKAAFNCAMFALETAGAVAIFNQVLGTHDRLSPWAWLATGLAVGFTSLLGSTLVSVVITIATGERPRTLTEVFRLGPLGDLANASCALVAVYIVSEDWRAAWLLLVFTGVLVVAYRSYEGARQRSESLEQLNRFTELVGREVQLDAVVGRVLGEVRTAFEVETVQLRLHRPGEPVRDWVLRGDVAESRTASLVEGPRDPSRPRSAVAPASREVRRACAPRRLGRGAGLPRGPAPQRGAHPRHARRRRQARRRADVHRSRPAAAAGARQPCRGGDRQRRPGGPDHQAGRGT